MCSRAPQELKRFLEERGDDVGKYTEKDQLVARVVEVANEGPQGPGGQVRGVSFGTRVPIFGASIAEKEM